MSNLDAAVRAVSGLVTIVTVNAVLVIDLLFEAAVTSTHVVMVIFILLGFNLGLSSLLQDSTVQTERSRQDERPSVEAVKQRYVEDDDYTIYDMEDDMMELLEEEEE